MNFMLADIGATLLAMCLFPLFVMAPGYVIAWQTDLFDFRQRTAAFRWALSIPLSIAVSPVLIYLLARFGSMTVVWCAFGVVWLGFFACRPAFPRIPAAFLRPAAIWIALASLSLIDLQFGNRLYFPIPALDYAVRTAFIASMDARGIPASTPFFFPGHAVPLRYHYFWLQVCSLVDQAGGALVEPRHAWIAGAAWCGIGVMVLVALYFRLFWGRGGADDIRRRALIGISLLAVTGLDIIPAIILWVLRAAGMPRAVRPSVEWWNEQIDGFVFTGLWEAHYVASLIACLMAFLILWHAASQPFWKRMAQAVIAGAALASAVGAGIYIAFVFAVFLALWTFTTIRRQWWHDTAVLAVAGAAAAVLSVPYLLGLRGPGSGGPPLQFWIRPFSPVNGILEGLGIVRGWTPRVINAAMLPLNYFLELGFFLVGSTLWWHRRHAARKPLSREELALGLMVTSSMVICTFFRSSVIGNNDLGWRGFLIAQFGMLLWSADLLAGARSLVPRRTLLTVLLALGAAGSAYDVLILRSYPLLADAGVLPTIGWLAPDRRLGERTLAVRSGYEWVAHSTPSTARIQFNPHVVLQETWAFLYSSRQIVAADEECLITFGGAAAECRPIVDRVRQFYPANGQGAPAAIGELCHDLTVDLVIARDTDSVWADALSWVWKEHPVFANRFIRVFRCSSLRVGALSPPIE